MGFKDAIARDINNTFLNAFEFAETAVINDKEMLIIPNDEELNKLETDKKLAACEIVFHVDATNFEHIPKPEFPMKFNGTKYRIGRVIDNMGMLTIGLERPTA